MILLTLMHDTNFTSCVFYAGCLKQLVYYGALDRVNSLVTDSSIANTLGLQFLQSHAATI